MNSMSVCNFVYSRDLGAQLRRRIVGVMFRSSKIDVTMCRPSEMDVLTFEDRCVDPRRSVIDVSM